MLLGEAQAARAVGGLSVALGTAATVAPAAVGGALGARIVTGQDRYLARQVGLDLAALGAVLLTASEAQRRRPLQNVVASALALAAVSVGAARSGDVPTGYAVRMVAAGTALGALALLPMIGGGATAS